MASEPPISAKSPFSLFDVEVIGKHDGCGGDVLFLSNDVQGTRKCLRCTALGPEVIIGTDGDAYTFDLDDVTIVVSAEESEANVRRSVSLQ